MTRQVRFESEAATELGEAALWYEGRRKGLGLAFVGAVDRAIEAIGKWPDAGSPVPYVADELPVRRVPIPRFPYQVVYLMSDEVVRVLAIVHERQRPGYWATRISR